jgi:hypothetical protein
VLVFHPEEAFFPTDPLFSLDSLAGSAPASGESGPEALGTPASRADAYLSLSVGEKSRQGTVYDRACVARPGGHPRVVLEYWLYYVRNDYRVRGNLLPFWFDGSHPNDLEHIHLVLRPEGDEVEGFAIESGYASAHEGKVPVHRFRPRPDAGRHIRFLVERGSHALAPDLDGDGVYTPGPDGDSGYKTIWGVRDRGITWARYKADYMDARDREAIVLEHDPASDNGTLPYRLAPVADLDARFSALDLTDADREAAFEDERHWFRRLFGGDNGSSESLLRPPVPRVDTESVGIRPFESGERGVMLGATFSFEEPGLFLGGRYAFLNGSEWLPDLFLEADGILTRDKAYVSSRLLATYPLDGSTRIMAGRSLITDSIRFDRRQWDWVGVIEFTLGRMRVSGMGRTIGPLSGLSKEFRLFYLF